MPLFKVFFLLAPIIWVIRGINFDELSQTFNTVPLWVVPASLTTLFVRAFLQSYRYKLLISPFTNDVSTVEMIKLDMKARYYSIIIPSSLGLDISRGALLKKKISTDQMVSSSLFFRITGVIPLFVFSFVGILLLAGREEFRQFIIPLSTISVLAILVTVSLFSKRISLYLISHVSKILPKKISNFIPKVAHSFQLYRNFKTLHFFNFLASTISQLLIIFSSFIVLKAVTGTFYPIEIFTFIPVTEILSLLVPIAPNGAGARETMYILLFKILGRSREEMLIFISISSLLYFVSLSGIFVVLYEKIRSIKRETNIY